MQASGGRGVGSDIEDKQTRSTSRCSVNHRKSLLALFAISSSDK